MIAVRSTFEATPIVPAHTGGAVIVDVGQSLVLAAVNTHPTASYAWDLGDGTSATGPSVTHAYAEDGVYVAKLTVTVNAPGGARSRHFARIQARNVPPSVDAGPDRTVDEGELVAFTATFTDPEWPDTHEATWNWGDYQPPTAGAVAEVNQPPTGSGTVTGSHAWGDNGTYEVTLTVRDDDGGVGEDTAEVTVLNVPPVVDAGPDLYAYPCTVITLEGRFTDPGWLDTHTATWAFGDCTPAQTALVAEKHEPPAGEGSVVASHIYERCGHYNAVCRVVDDDGGVGSDAAVIRVITVANAGFEHGFRARREGAVANGWEPYLVDDAGGEDKGNAGGVFVAEALLVHGGRRSQRVITKHRTRAGILQQLGANMGWDYQVSAWYSLAEREGGTARLGLDPAGGMDPDAPGVMWSDGAEHREWAELAGRVSAQATLLTIFLEADPGGSDVDACFDDVALVPIQPFCPVPPRLPEERCVDFADLGPRAKLPPSFERDGFRFSSADGSPQYIVSWGPPPGVGKLAFHSAGLEIGLPFAARRVTLLFAAGATDSVTVVALDADGDVVATAAAAPYVLKAERLVALVVKGGSGEAALVSLCAEPATDRGNSALGRPMQGRRR